MLGFSKFVHETLFPFLIHLHALIVEVIIYSRDQFTSGLLPQPSIKPRAF
jgi:hypothetical protein